MSPIPCFQGTCSVDLTYDPVFGLMAAARLAGTGSLDCIDRPDPDATDGLFVQVSGLANDATSGIAPAAVPCGQSLGRDTGGNLFAYPEGAQGLTQAQLPSNNAALSPLGKIDSTTNPAHVNNGGGGVDGFHVPTGAPQFNDTIDLLNPFDCTAWVFYTINEIKIMGQRETGTDEHFYVSGSSTINVTGEDLSLITTNTQRFDHFGSWSGAGGLQNMQRAQHMHAFFRLLPLQTAHIQHTVTISGKHHISMDTGVDEGIVVLHPEALVFRQDARP